ncbi:MAG: hypothetical protein WCN21_06935 [Comamonadaceae bacterium]
MKNVFFLTVAALAASLLGCGGSPASAPVPVAPVAVPLSTSLLQGIWRSPSGAASTLSAVVLPNGAMWALISNASSTRVLKANFEGQLQGFVGSGKSFTLGTATSSAISLTATVVEASSLTGAFSAGTQSENFSMAYQPRYASAAQLVDFAGAWSEVVGPGTVNWSISDQGVITGTRTTGCTYTGALNLRTERKAVVDVAVTENCAGAVTLLNGIAVKSEDKLAVTMLMTNKDETAAVALSLTH